MKNPRITPKERGLLKGAIRRVFSRSDLRRKVLDSAEVPFASAERPRVRKWVRCAVCLVVVPKYLAVADHIIPVVPVTTSFEDMSLDDVADRVWCEESNLQPICPSCHKLKTKQENKERRDVKRSKANKKTSS